MQSANRDDSPRRGFACLPTLLPLLSQLGHLKSLLDSKAGQEDLTSITKAMGDVEETLSVVRQAVPGQSALLELQVTCIRRDTQE